MYERETAGKAVAGTPAAGPSSGGEPHVEMSATLTAPSGAGAAVTKVVVAVHGVGDQHSYATIQSVVNQFCAFFHQPAGVPLGSFHGGGSAYSVPAPYPDEPFRRFAFAEVYWAKIPRTVVDDKHTLEEAKNWARTIVERLRLRWRSKGAGGGCRDQDFRLIHQVLAEMIQTIAVLERLSFLAEKAGVFRFDLKRLLEDYLGDVQIVSEFGEQRREILEDFDRVMTAVNRDFPGADIYIIAHSEGTVISFLGLLEGIRDARGRPWTDRVRGFMTLGSPIDKHLVLWPELFGEGPPPRVPQRRIEWRNYYDHGDPIGFALDDARAWLELHGWTGVFNFTGEEGQDNGFSRYPFPGKAHVDYWTDNAVFGHFITTVMGEKSPQPDVDYREPPKTRTGSQIVSYLVPYLCVMALLVVGAYVLYKAVTAAIFPNETHLAVRTIAVDVAGIAWLMFGTTVVARIPRLTRSRLWRGAAISVGLLAAAMYLWSVREGPAVDVGGAQVRSGAVTVALALTLSIIVYVIGAVRPAWGLWPLISLGALAVAGKVAFHVIEARTAGEVGPVWPVVVATVAFLYLWWLASLLFDLVFVWHLYIRHARVLQRIDDMLGKDPGARRSDASGVTARPSLPSPQVQR